MEMHLLMLLSVFTAFMTHEVALFKHCAAPFLVHGEENRKVLVNQSLHAIGFIWKAQGKLSFTHSLIFFVLSGT